MEERTIEEHSVCMVIEQDIGDTDEQYNQSKNLVPFITHTIRRIHLSVCLLDLLSIVVCLARMKIILY